MKSAMQYFKSKIKALRGEYTEPDKARLIKEKDGRCELCQRKAGDPAIFGPTHYIKKKILFEVQIGIHKIRSHGVTHKVVLCDFCHLGYHLYGRLDPDAMFGNLSVSSVRRMPSKAHGQRQYGNGKKKIISRTVSQLRKKKGVA